PCHVRMYVMSPTHSMSGAGASNCPCTRSGIVGGVGSGVVVRTQRAGRRPRRPAAFINRATRLRPTSCPWARNSASTRGTPCCPAGPPDLPTRNRVASPNPRRQPRVVLPPLRRLPSLPLVVGGAGDLGDPAQLRHRIPTTLRLDEPVPAHRVSIAKKAAARL